MMQRWSEYLEEMQRKTKVVAIRGEVAGALVPTMAAESLNSVPIPENRVGS